MYVDFDYRCPRTLKELFQALSECGEGALIYAGGTDLLVLLRGRKISAKYLIDVKKIPELNGVAETDDWVSIGAATRFFDLRNSPAVVRWARPLAQASNSVGSVQIRFKGTLGGNIQTASPSGDGLNAAWGLDAWVRLSSAEGKRRMPLSEFVTAPRRTLLRRGEVIERIEIPKRKWSFQNFFKIGRRNALAISVVSGVVALEAGAAGRITEARVSLGAVAPTPIRIAEAEELLRGKIPDASLAEAVSRMVREKVRPISDIRASAEYRAYMAGVSVRRQIMRFVEEPAK